MSRKLCGCGNPALIKERSSTGKIYYRTNCYNCMKIAKSYKKKYCENCGYVSKSKGDLDIDHIDANRSNNKESNLQTLCRPCHIEKTKTDNSNKKPKRERRSVRNKYCNKCYTTKSADDFYKYYKSSDGLQPYCKDCQNADDKIRREKRSNEPATIIRDKKTCRMCEQTKPASQFGLRSSSADKMMSYCKPCWSIKTRKAMQRMYSKSDTIEC